MSRLPALTPRKLVAALKKAGYYESSQTGSHLMLEHATRRMVVVPKHARDISRPLMMSILKQAGLSQEQFIELL